VPSPNRLTLALVAFFLGEVSIVLLLATLAPY